MIQRLAAVTIAIAGVVHLVLVPEHLGHSVVHGIFFAVVGAAEILWAAWFWSRPTKTAFFAGFALAGGLIVLWAITRLIAPPFEHGPGPVDVSGVICKLAEGAGLASLAALAVQGMVAGIRAGSAWRTAGLAIALALVAGLGTYGVGRAAEPLLPGLAPAGEHEHEAAESSETTHAEPSPGHEHMGGGAPSASGDAVVLGDLTVESAWARPAHAGDNSAVYFVLSNAGDGMDRLLGAAAEVAATTEVHRTTMQGDVMSMEPLPDGIDLPPHSEVVLEPGGYHIMLLGLLGDLVPGQQVKLTLRFELAGELTLEAVVAEP